ncbi:MAG TPA: helix-turn-helix transcriptional regulator [Candidatus Angelobacter sp.]|jgi:transcriptional regulator with XRE-family HTH domain
MSNSSKTLRRKFSDKEYRHVYSESFRNSWIAGQIKAIREMRGWTQSKLAEECEMKQARISLLEDVNYESWNIATLRRIARAFDVDLVVKFESFLETIKDAGTFSAKTLEVPSFPDDPEITAFDAEIASTNSGTRIREENETDIVLLASKPRQEKLITSEVPDINFKKIRTARTA